MSEKQYRATLDDSEKKLDRVMERLGVEKYESNWTSGKAGNSCYVEMLYGGRAYRFENSTAKSYECGRKLAHTSDLFAAVVLSLEALARAVEQGIFSLDMLLEGKLALPEGQPLEPCFQALGFASRPKSKDEVKEAYRRMSKAMHPDKGGNEEEFIVLNENYRRCLELLGIAT